MNASETASPRATAKASERVEAGARPFILIALFVTVYLLTALAHAKRRFWYDELFTLYISKLPRLADVWAALMDGLDFNPPILYLSTRLSHSLFGISNVSTRVPQIVGFLVMSICLYLIVRRRCGYLYGFAAMCIPPMTSAYYYASEARAYGIVLGWCGLAILFWQKCAEGGRRRFALFGLFISITGLVTTQCYTVLILVAFAIGELARLIILKRVDWPVWLCLFAPTLSGIIYLPMLRNVKAYVIDSIAFRSSLLLAPRFYSFLLRNDRGGWDRSLWAEAVWPVLISLLLIALFRASKNEGPEEIVSASAIPRYEIAFLLGLSVLPVFGQLLATMARAPFLDRYALSAVIGISALLPMLAFSATRANQRVAAGIALTFSVFFILDFATWFDGLTHHEKWDLPSVELSSLPGDGPIVIADPLTFLEADFYEPPQIAARLRFLTDHHSALQFAGTDMFDRGYYTMRKWFPLKGQIVEYKEFLAANPSFFVESPSFNPEVWLLRRMTDDGVDLRFIRQITYPATHGAENVLLQVSSARK